jgi:two-component system, LytTR family, response regulator
VRCIAIDDEPLALELIEDFCKRINFLEMVTTCTSAVEAMDLLSKQAIDLVFVDINMPQVSGLDFVKSLSNPPIIIFTTAYSEHAAKGFDLDAIDYLVKPIPFERFLKAVYKANEIFEARNKKTATLLSGQLTSGNPKFLLIKVGYSTVKINLEDILYIEGVKDYIKIVVKDMPKSFVPRITMTAIMERLPADNFVRVHKSFIVSLSHMERIENNGIIISGKHIPIGEQYKNSFYSIIDVNRI